MYHLETLIRQFYEWQGYLVRGNVNVGRRSRGGWEGELDVVAYHPESKHLIHIEASLDGYPWDKKEVRFKKKFQCGKKYIDEVFPWLDKPSSKLDQVAIIVRSSRDKVGGARVELVNDFMGRVKKKIEGEGVMIKNAIPEQYGLLRTIQMVVNGYNRSPKK